MKLSQLLPKFIRNLKSDKKSDSTIIAYKKDIEQLIDFLQNKEISKTSKKDIEKFIKHIMKNNGFSAKTASRKINSFNTFFRFALSQKLINENPAARLKHPDPGESLPRCLTQIEYKAIRDTARSNLRLYTLIELLLQTGARIGEISRLKIEDVNLDNKLCQIMVHEYESNSARIIELNNTADKAMRMYLKTRQIRPNDKGYLFNTRTGKNMIIRNIRTALDRVFKKAGVQGIKVNDLRNTFICYQIENGVGLKAIAKYVGHKRTLSTEKYLRITERKTPGTVDEIIAL